MSKSQVEMWRDHASDSLMVTAFGYTLKAPMRLNGNAAVIAETLLADAERQGMAHDRRQETFKALLNLLMSQKPFISFDKTETLEQKWQREAQAEVDAICTSLRVSP